MTMLFAPNTRLVHWLTDAHSGSFAPACRRQARISFADFQFTLLLHYSELKISEANAPSNIQLRIF